MPKTGSHDGRGAGTGSVVGIGKADPDFRPLAPLLPYAALALLVGVMILYLVSAFWSPARSFPDRLAGTFLVPR
jgi:hypothetical protein